MKIIDAHSHLWLKQDTTWNGKTIRSMENGRSMFLGEEVQMVPPFMIDSKNSAEVFLSNMNYAQVAAAVVTQEFIDGIQNDYLQEVQARYPDRFLVCGMADYFHDGFAEEARRLMDERGWTIYRVAKEADGDTNVAEMQEIIQECPRLKIAIGHFGMPTTEHWHEQIRLAQNDNVFIESGGITWLFNSEFYPFNGAIRAIREAIDIAGIEKLMWGSDYPRTITAITYRMSYDFVLKSNELTEREKELFLGENARLFYGFQNLPTLPYIKNMSE